MKPRAPSIGPDLGLAATPLPSDAAGRPLQSFGRFEFKYLVPQPIRQLLEAELREFMQVDPFCSQSSEQAYYVRSLYFDDPGYGDYYEKTDGLLQREKYRIRTYGRSADAPHFLEIKGRQNHFSYKHRAFLEPALLNRIEAHDWIRLISCASGNSVLARFAAAALRRNLRATLAVEYWRRPYISRLDYRFRATFDHDIRGLRMSRLAGRPESIRTVLPGYTVLEIKFAQSVPAWFQRLIGAYELQRVSVSKYCRAAEALTLVQNLE
jgi:SPX domain protein involved in polyphosphate accumulation